MSVKKLLRELIRDDRGQSTTEYILILAVVVMVALKFKTTFSARLQNTIEKLGTDIDGAVQ